MRIFLHIGPDAVASSRMQSVLASKRAQLESKGILYPRSAGGQNHTRLYMVATDPDAPDALRLARGFGSAADQSALRLDLERSLLAEIDRVRPETLILSAYQLGACLTTPGQLTRVHRVLTPYSDDIRVIACIEDPARMLLRRYAGQVLEGRLRSLQLELSLLEHPDWWHAAIATAPAQAAHRGVTAEAQMAVHWLDFKQLVALWDGVFGRGATALHAYDDTAWASPEFPDVLRQIFALGDTMGKADPWAPPPLPPAAWLTRCRQFNDALLRLMALRGANLPPPVWRQFLQSLWLDGPADSAGHLSAISARFAPDHSALLSAHPGLTADALTASPPQPDWSEADPRNGFRATQYLMAHLPRIDAALRRARRPQTPSPPPSLSPDAQRLMPELARQKFQTLVSSPFAPHNTDGASDTRLLPAFTAPAQRAPLPHSTGRVVVACMKTEAPYILEWIAHHRMIGVDTFVIYTNDSQDTTDPLLQRLAEMGVVHHRSNDGWRGKSPQQHALNQALRDPVVQASDWIIHIDVDEFINVRCGNGTLDDFLAQAPAATHVAMTWRLFGHSGVQNLKDAPVTTQFDACAPRFCPKPHMSWGFKTMARNTGAYRKLSCHRPNQLTPGSESGLRWVNGNARDVTRELARRGWRSTRSSVGYDLLQLNHYPLRSAESFLIKRQRGRALHVDRTIGLGYWIRNDWSGARDTSIRRHSPRMLAEMARLMADPEIARLHHAGVAWHRAKAAELRQTPEFRDLFDQAIALTLTDAERAAWTLALDLEG